jgi:hypothetical protein
VPIVLPLLAKAGHSLNWEDDELANETEEVGREGMD